MKGNSLLLVSAGFVSAFQVKSPRFPSRTQLFETKSTTTSVPILSASDEPEDFDYGCVANPVVLPPTNEDEKWKCFYYGNSGSWNKDIPCFLPTGWCGLAESDNGLDWKKVAGDADGGAVLGPSAEGWDSVQIGVGDVVRLDSGDLIMYYFGGSDEALPMGPGGSILGFRMRIGRARSVDGGRTWEKLGMCLDFDENEGFFAAWPRLIVPKDQTQQWNMMYHAFNGEKWRVFGATSRDQGETWTRTGLVLEGSDDAFDCSGIGTRAVTAWRDGLLMVYEGVDENSRHRLGAALCQDSKGSGDWNKLQNGQPILEPGRGSLGEWTSHVIGTPYLVSMPNGSIRIYHCGKPSAEAKMAIGVVVSKTGDVSSSSWEAMEEVFES